MTPDPNCKACGGSGRVHRSWSAGGDRIGYRTWTEECLSCRMREVMDILKINEEALDWEPEIEALGGLLF